MVLVAVLVVTAAGFTIYRWHGIFGTHGDGALAAFATTTCRRRCNNDNCRDDRSLAGLAALL